MRFVSFVDPLPTDPGALRALLLAEREKHAEEIAAADQNIARLTAIIKELQRYRFGARSEKIDADQLALMLEDVEQTLAAATAESEKKQTGEQKEARRKRRINRGALPAHLPREEIVVDVADKSCPCCKGLRHVIAEDVSERLDVTPARFKVIVTRRPKYACRSCEGEVAQAPAQERLIEGGVPTEALVAHVIVSKYADHLPLYRQAQIYARQGIELDRSTLADWVGRAAYELRPVHERLLETLKSSTRLFADETPAPMPLLVVCRTIITQGNASEAPASASDPSFPRKNPSKVTMPVNAIRLRIFGADSLSSVGKIGPSSSRLVRAAAHACLGLAGPGNDVEMVAICLITRRSFPAKGFGAALGRRVFWKPGGCLESPTDQ